MGLTSQQTRAVVVAALAALAGCQEVPVAAEGATDGEGSTSGATTTPTTTTTGNPGGSPSTAADADGSTGRGASTGDGPESETGGQGDTDTDGGPSGLDCGDGVVTPGEACDDGNGVESDGCNPDCRWSGTLLWSHAHDGGHGGSEEAFAVAWRSGGLSIAGYATQPDGSYDGWLGRLNQQGELTSTIVVAGTVGGNDVLRGLATTQTSVYAVGQRASSNAGLDAWTRRLDAEDSTVWTDNYDATERGDVGRAVAVDPSGNVVVAGSSNLGGSQASDLLIRKLDPNGAAIWTVSFSGPVAGGSDRIDGIVSDANGFLYAAGSVATGQQGRDGWLGKIDLDGNLLWSRTMSGEAALDDEWSGVALDPTGAPVVCGFEGVTDGRQRWLLRSYDADGELQWTESGDGETAEGARCFGIAADDLGRLVAVGDELQGTRRVAWVAKFEPDGGPWWSVTLPSEVGHSRGRAVAFGPDRTVFVAGLFDEGGGNDLWAAALTP